MSINDCLQGNKLKHETTIDLEILREFRRQHDAHINKDSPDPIFKPEYSFTYKSSTCGTCVTITCECGEKKDITYYSHW